MDVPIRQLLATAKPGTSLTYHTGPSLSGCQNLKAIRRLYDAGEIDLVQRRCAQGFEYIAMFRRVPARIMFAFAEAGL